MALEDITEKFTCIPITRNSLEKIKTYANIVGGFECYGFLVSPADSNDGIIYDAILAPHQEVSAGHAKISGEAAAIAKNEITSRNYKALGFWHSHGNFSPFHSPTDDSNMKNLILSFAGDTEEKDTVIPEGYTEKDGKLIFRIGLKEIAVKQEKDDIRYVHSYNNDKYSNLFFGMQENGIFFINNGNKRVLLDKAKSIDISENYGKTLKRIGIAYSIVVNKKGAHYSQMGISKWCDSCERLETKINEVKLKIVDVPNDIELNNDCLRKEIKKKINYSKTKHII